MQHTMSLPHYRPSSPPTRKNRTRNRGKSFAYQALQTPDTAIDNQNPFTPQTLTFPSTSSSWHDSMNPKSLNSVKKIHARIIKSTDECDSDWLAHKLIQTYSKFGDFRSAAMVFCISYQYGILSWTSLFNGFNDRGNLRELLQILQELHRMGMVFNAAILTAALTISVDLSDWWSGVEIHAFVIKMGLDSDPFLKCSTMDFYANYSSWQSVDMLFEESKDVKPILWNKMVALNAESGQWPKALELFRKMQTLSVKADEVTIAKAIHVCSRLGALKEGKAIHGYAARSGILPDLFISNTLISMYSKNTSVQLARRVFESIGGKRNVVSWNSMISSFAANGFLEDALELFDKMDSSGVEPDLVTWNSLISGHALHGSDDKVLSLFRRMLVEGVKPNSNSITSTLQTVADLCMLEFGKEIHGYIVRHGLECSVYVGTSLVDMYVKCCTLADARKAFDNIKNRNVCTWNALISGYAYDGSFDEALDLLKQMEREGVRPDIVTWNGLISGYSMKGMSKQALVLMRQLKGTGTNLNVVSWTALISGCCQNGDYLDALYFFTEMLREKIQPNSATLASLLRACAALALLKKGAELHCFAIAKRLDDDIFVATALIDMYSKSGNLLNARRVFDKILNKNQASWNAMIMGFAGHGIGKEAISYFDQMCRSGIQPDGITFTALLSGCRHSGMITEGWKYFDAMSRYNVFPTLEHYACMVDLLARGGYLDEAWDFIQRMPVEPDASVWGALLGACRTHKNLNLAEIAARHLFKLEPYNSANYLLMISIYASKKKWENVEIMRDAMVAAGVKNRAGWSWIQIDECVHVFNVEGKPHPDIGMIYFELYQLISQMRESGYVPDTSCIVHNVSEDEKEKLLMGHTEKLAITYGLISTDKGTPIRVIKNTRVCNDCHLVAKTMSKLSGREIFLRDGVRFHHFVDGECSCSDYW